MLRGRESAAARGLSDLGKDRMSERDSKETIDAFGEQWTRFTENRGHYASQELWRDIIGPLVPDGAFKGARVADIGSGTGRFADILLQIGAAEVVAIEPSAGFQTLRQNLAHWGERVKFLNVRGDQIPSEVGDLDWVISIGVLHHIPEPDPVVRAAFRALRPGGHILIWLYGREGNAAYLSWVEPLRRLTTALPPMLLRWLSWAMTLPLSLYAALCDFVPFLPLSRYMTATISKLDWKTRMLVIYDQLAPAWSKFYRGEEARALLSNAGFVNVRLHHRNGYSWTALGERPSS